MWIELCLLSVAGDVAKKNIQLSKSWTILSLTFELKRFRLKSSEIERATKTALQSWKFFSKSVLKGLQLDALSSSDIFSLLEHGMTSFGLCSRRSMALAGKWTGHLPSQVH